MSRTLLCIAAGGILGSISRFLLSKAVTRYLPYAFPVGTFLVNASGCFLIGILWGLGQKYQWMDNDLRSFLMIGFCGGYTTFSAFALENVQLMENGNISVALLYSLASVVTGVLLTYAGYGIVKVL